MKVKFGDSTHNMQKMRDTMRAEQGRADNGLYEKIAEYDSVIHHPAQRKDLGWGRIMEQKVRIQLRNGK